MPVDRRRHPVLPLALVIVVAAVIAGCRAGAPVTAETPAATDQGATSVGPSEPAAPSRTIPRVSLAPSAATGEVPADVVAAVVADAASRTGVASSDIAVVLAEAVTWPNGAMGCPKPGMMYTQALVPGYRVVVEAGGDRLDYRGSQTAPLTICENPPGPG